MTLLLASRLLLRHTGHRGWAARFRAAGHGSRPPLPHRATVAAASMPAERQPRSLVDWKACCKQGAKVAGHRALLT